MDRLIVGSDALAVGIVTRHDLRTNYFKVHQNVYAPTGMELDARVRAHAAWLWSRGQATLFGHSAAAMFGTRWLPPDRPAELARIRHRSPRGIVIYSGTLADDEVCLRGSFDCTTPARTAYDLGRRAQGDLGIMRIDALLNATGCTIAEVQVSRTAIPAHGASVNCARRWVSSMAARNRRKRPSFACSSSVTGCPARPRRSALAIAESIWAGTSGKWASSTTGCSIGRVPTFTPETSNVWSSWPRKAG